MPDSSAQDITSFKSSAISKTPQTEFFGNLYSSNDNGHARRLSRILPNGGRRSLVLGIDHPVFDGHVDGLGSVPNLLVDISSSPLDAVLMSPSTMRNLNGSILSNLKSLVLRVDTTAAFRPGRSENNTSSMTVTGEEIVRSGADAATCFFLINDGGNRVADHRKHLIEISRICHKYGFPLIVEALGVRKDGSTSRDLKTILHAGKLAAELGATILKIDAPENAEDLKSVIQTLECPVFIRGGVPKENPELMFAEVSSFMKAGAAGIVYGRSIFQSASPTDTICRLRTSMDAEFEATY